MTGALKLTDSFGAEKDVKISESTVLVGSETSEQIVKVGLGEGNPSQSNLISNHHTDDKEISAEE